MKKPHTPTFQPSPGDILSVNRGPYKHYGIYAGDGKVIHYTTPKGDFGFDISVRETTLDKFIAGGKCRIVEIKQGFSPEETLERARSRIGEEKYNLLFNNCEHFVYECKTGKKKSNQINTFFTAVAMGGLAGAAVIAAVKTRKENT
jgi:hypothetical protein